MTNASLHGALRWLVGIAVAGAMGRGMLAMSNLGWQRDVAIPTWADVGFDVSVAVMLYGTAVSALWNGSQRLVWGAFGVAALCLAVGNGYLFYQTVRHAQPDTGLVVIAGSATQVSIIGIILVGSRIVIRR